MKDREGRPLKVSGVVPKLSATPGRLRSPALSLGEHNEVLKSDGGWPGRGAGWASFVAGGTPVVADPATRQPGDPPQMV